MDTSFAPADPKVVIDLLEDWLILKGCPIRGTCDHSLCINSREAIATLEDTLALAEQLASLMLGSDA